jgi:hypothetical protein
MVAAAVRTIFAQPDAAHVRSQLDEVTRMLASQFPDVATLLGDAAEICPPSPASLRPTGASCGRRTPSSASTVRSSGGQTWWASFPTMPRCCAW